MKIKRTLVLLITFVALSNPIIAQTKLMQITTIEGLVGGGFVKPKMIITDENGKQTEKKLDNLANLSGLKLKNLKTNDLTIVSELKKYISEGWEIINTTPYTMQLGGNAGAFILTRYMLKKN